MTRTIGDRRDYAEQYLLGVLDEPAVEEFERRLGEDDELLFELVTASRQEAALRRALQTLADNRVALVDAPTPVRTIHTVREPGRRPVPARRRRTGMWLGWAVAAAVALFFGVLFMNRESESPAPRVAEPRVVTPSPEVEEVVVPKAPAQETPMPVAADTGIASVMGVISDAGIRRGVQKLPCAKGMTLREGDWIATGADGKVFVSYTDDAARLTVGAGSSVQMAKSAPEKQIRIAAGSVKASVSPAARGTALTIQTPQAEVVVKGTLFDATVRTEDTTVGVLKGLVGAKSVVSGKSIDVQAGEVATLDKNGGISVKPIDDEIDEGSHRKEFPLPEEMVQPVTCVCDGSMLWVGDRQLQMLFKLDPADGRLVGKISVGYLGEFPTLCDWDGRNLWLHTADGKIHSIDPRDGKRRKTIELPVEKGWRITGSAIHGDTLYQFVRPEDKHDMRQRMMKISLETGKVMSARDVESKWVNRVTYLNGKLWLRRNVIIEKLDPDTGVSLGTFKGPQIHFGDIGDDDVGSVWLVTKSTWKAYLVDTGERPWKK